MEKIVTALTTLIGKLTEEGGLFRVRALIVIIITVVGGIYLLEYQAMPPAEFNAIWTLVVGWYFLSRS